MKIHVLPSGPIQTIGYLLTEPKLGTAVLVDAPGGIMAKIRPLLEKEGCQLTELWLTHGHWDHMQDGAAVKRETGALVEEKPYENNVGYSQRAGVPIEPRLTQQWWLRYPRVEEAKQVVRDGLIKLRDAWEEER